MNASLVGDLGTQTGRDRLIVGVAYIGSFPSIRLKCKLEDWDFFPPTLLWYLFKRSIHWLYIFFSKNASENVRVWAKWRHHYLVVDVKFRRKKKRNKNLSGNWRLQWPSAEGPWPWSAGWTNWDVYSPSHPPLSVPSDVSCFVLWLMVQYA